MNLVTDHKNCALLNGPVPDRADYDRRLAQFWQSLAENSVAVIVAYPERTRSQDTEHTYRPASDILYLNGFPEPESVLVVTKLKGRLQRRTIMFVRPKDRTQEIWTGIREGVTGAKKNYGADDAYTVDQFEKILAGLIGQAENVYYRFGINPEFDEKFRKVWEPSQKQLSNPETILHEMRLFKSDNELDLTRHACRVSAEAHRHGMQNTTPGMTEGQLQSVIEYAFGLHGAREVAYGTIVANGNHACVLHYTENDGSLVGGDLVLVDAGGEYHGYASDITRTWPVNGKFTDAQRDIYQLVLDAQVAAIKAARPGVPLIAIHRTAARVMRAGLKKLSVLPATSTAASDRKIVKAKAAAKKALKGAADKATYPLTLWDFFMHGTSHWMGLDVHDVGSYEAPSGSANNNRNKASKQRQLQPGMVFTVEPGLYLEKSDTRVPARYRGIGIRIEDDVVITADGCEVLTRDVPKTIADIEALMASR